MRLIKGSLAGLVLAGILAMMPAATFAHGGGGGGGGGVHGFGGGGGVSGGGAHFSGGGSHFSGGGSHFAGAHFTARSGNRFHRHFHNGNGGVVIFDPLDYSSYYDLPTDGTVYQGQVAPQDAESVPYATPTSDPDIVISPYEPHAIISVAGIPQGAKVQDPVSNLVFLNPSGW